MKIRNCAFALLAVPIAAAAQTNAVPPAKPSVTEVVVDGLRGGAEVTLRAGDVGLAAGTAATGEVDMGYTGILERAGDVVDSAGHVYEAQKLFRQGDAEGMLIYGGQEYGEHLLDKAVEGVVGPTYAPAWRVGRFLGDLIKENVKINNITIEDHVTNLYYNASRGWRENEAFERNTSDEAIERHRQMLRQQRAAQFSSMSRSNEQAAANRAAQAAQASSGTDNAAFTNEMMITLMPALISASQRPPVHPPLVAPQQYPHPSMVPVAPAGRSLPLVSPPLGSTFGSPPSEARGSTRGCPPRDQLPNFCRGNAECGGCYQ